MKIRNVVHKGLRRFIETADASGLQPAVIEKIRRIVTFLQDMEGEDEIRTVPSLEGAQADRRSNGNVEPVRDEKLASSVQDRPG